MSAVLVEATAPGEYNGHYYERGRQFVLVDRKNAEGDILQYGIHESSPNQAFCSYKKRGGWMKVVEAPAQVMQRAQMQADLNSSAPLNPLSNDARPAGSIPVPTLSQGMTADARTLNASANDLAPAPLGPLDAVAPRVPAAAPATPARVLAAVAPVAPTPAPDAAPSQSNQEMI